MTKAMESADNTPFLDVANIRRVMDLVETKVRVATGMAEYRYTPDVDRLTAMLTSLARAHWVDAAGPEAHQAVATLNEVAATRLASEQFEPEDRMAWYRNTRTGKRSQRKIEDMDRRASDVQLAATGPVRDFIEDRRARVQRIQSTYINDPLAAMVRAPGEQLRELE
jgi:hypothetical protein